jgi:hypothetical protein
MNLYETHDKVLAVVDSCLTYEQFEIAKVYAETWIDWLAAMEIKATPLAQDVLVDCMTEVSHHLKLKCNELTPPLP